MKNILLTSKNGFLAKEFARYFSNEKIFNINRQDLENFKSLKQSIVDNNIDFILHTSWAGVVNDSADDLDFNIKVYNNLEKCSEFVKLIFLFGSGAELFKDLSSDYCKGKLYVFDNAKKHSNMINLRLFGCFGEFEDDKRFIKSSVNKIINHSKITINKDKFMDFIFVEDLCAIVEKYMNSENKLPTNLDCVYDEKYKLSDVARFINKLFNLKESDYNVLNTFSLDDPYIGSGLELNLLNLNLIGLKGGIEKLYGQKAENFRFNS